MTHTQLASPSEPIERGLLREWQRMYNAMDSKHEDKHPSIASFKDLRQRTHAALAEPSPVAQPVPADARDAARYRSLRWVQTADALGPIFRADVRRADAGDFRVGAAVDAAMDLAGQAPSAEGAK